MLAPGRCCRPSLPTSYVGYRRCDELMASGSGTTRADSWSSQTRPRQGIHRQHFLRCRMGTGLISHEKAMPDQRPMQRQRATLFCIVALILAYLSFGLAPTQVAAEDCNDFLRVCVP